MELYSDLMKYLKDGGVHNADNEALFTTLLSSHQYFKEVFPDKHTVNDKELKTRLFIFIDKIVEGQQWVIP